MMKRCLLALSLLLVANEAAAQTSPDMNSAPVVRKQLEWREGRSELVPGVGITVNDRYFANFILSMGYSYHVNNWISFGANVGYGIPIKTQLSQDIEREKSSPGASYAVPATHLGLLADVHVAVVPIYGKFLLPGGLALAYDFHLFGGGGVMQVVWNSDAVDRISAEDQWELAPHFGGGFRFFIDSGVAVSLDIIDRLAATYTATRADSSIPPEEWTHTIAVMLNVGIFLPYHILTEE